MRLSAPLQLVILAMCGFVTSFGAHIVATNLPSYAEIVGVGAFTIGVLIAVYDFAEVFAKPLAGVLADRRGMKATLLGGLSVFVLGSALFLAITPKLLVLVRFVQGLGAAALSTVSLALVARTFKEGRGKAFGIYNAIKGRVLRTGTGTPLSSWTSWRTRLLLQCRPFGPASSRRFSARNFRGDPDGALRVRLTCTWRRGLSSGKLHIRLKHFIASGGPLDLKVPN